MADVAALVRGAVAGSLALTYILLAHYTNSVAGMENLGMAVALTPITLALLSFAWRAAHRAALCLLLAAVAGFLILHWRAFSIYYGQVYWIEHAGTELALALVFARSLRAGQVPMCTSFARMLHGVLPPAVERYTRRITVAWVVFFAAMATTSTLIFLVAPLHTWSTFANFFTAPLIASMFVAEYIVRRFTLPGIEHAHIVDGVRAFWKSSAG